MFLHGLTFDQRTWRPVTGRLAGDVTSIVIDLPAHGGDPAPLETVTQPPRPCDSWRPR